jgi:hypothetical protein
MATKAAEAAEAAAGGRRAAASSRTPREMSAAYVHNLAITSSCSPAQIQACATREACRL